jgi:2-oxoglutarate ferredoxin oxidoreductase subunit gamma
MWRIAIRLAGEGGQGVGLAAAVLAEAALASGHEVTMLQTYGPEARGGASSADVVISDCQVANPKVLEADLLLLLNQTSWNKFARPPWRTPTTVLVVEQGRVQVEDTTAGNPSSGSSASGVLVLPFERLAREELREKVAANMMAVGAMGALVGCLTSGSLVESALARSPSAFRVVNKQAVERGWHLVADNPELAGLRATLARLGAPVLTEIDDALLVGTP